MKLTNVIKTNTEPKGKTNIIATAPYYGEKGSICKITELNNYYQVTRYDIDGKEGVTLPTPKKKAQNILKNYVEDLNKYLAKNEEKYITAMNQRSKSEKNKKALFAKGTALTAVTAISCVEMIFQTGTIATIAQGLFFGGFVATCHELHELKTHLTNEKNEKFIKEYTNYRQQVNEFNIKNTKTKTSEATKYSKLEGIKTPEYDLLKKRILTKESVQK